MNSSGGVTKDPTHRRRHAHKCCHAQHPQRHGRTVRPPSARWRSHPSSKSGRTRRCRWRHRARRRPRPSASHCTAWCSRESLVPCLGCGKQDWSDHGKEEQGRSVSRIRSPDATTHRECRPPRARGYDQHKRRPGRERPTSAPVEQGDSDGERGLENEKLGDDGVALPRKIPAGSRPDRRRPSRAASADSMA